VRSTTPDRPIFALNRAYVLLGLADGTLLPFIPLLLVQRGMSAAAIGLVLAAAAAGSFVVGLICAYLADRSFSAERMVIDAPARAGFPETLGYIVWAFTMIPPCVVALSLVRAPFMLLDPIALKRLRQSRRTDYARIRLRTSAGWAASSVASGALLQGVGLRWMPFVYAPLPRHSAPGSGARSSRSPMTPRRRRLPL
jgi:hypothetical protein